MGGKPTIPQPKVVRMPTPNDPSVIAAKAKAILAGAQRGGRQSTILSDNLGGGVNGAKGGLGA